MEEAWKILLQPHSKPVTREVTGHSEGRGDGDIQAPSRCYKLLAVLYDIYDPPGMPVDGDTVHQIEILPNAEPHYRC